MELPEEVHGEIGRLCREGDALLGAAELVEAKQRYVEALRLLPGDHRQWAAATWIYGAIGDVHFRLGVHDRAHKCFRNAVQCPGGLGNPYVHLRLGQTAFELGDHDRAADELIRAYMGAGAEVFEGEDPAYLGFLRTRAELDRPGPGAPDRT
ncbi:tetratricopeptide repeat protein [Kitasatospora sp. NPDC059146]|uniref:tetratricopeptide repeat protein n=1 Tax=Kitasatospora sp. NPDC059146 TaxID=3346741 RepID=UPI0036AC77AA